MSRGDSETVVFVMGTGHCGSTLLDLVLGSHPDAFSLGELWELTRRLEAGDGSGLCGVCEGECPFWEDAVSARVLAWHFSRGGRVGRLRRRLAPFTHDVYRHLLDVSGYRVLIDSSKSPAWIRRQLRPAYHWWHTRAFLVYLVRDGRAVANSYLRKYRERGMTHWARDWAARTARMNDFFDRFPAEDRMRVHYEDLASDPGAVVPELCRRLDLPYDPEMLRYWTKEHHPVGGNRGTRSLILRWRDAFPVGTDADGAGVTGAGEPYDRQVGLAIRLDERWKRELGEEDLATFERVAGSLNEWYD